MFYLCIKFLFGIYALSKSAFSTPIRLQQTSAIGNDGNDNAHTTGLFDHVVAQLEEFPLSTHLMAEYSLDNIDQATLNSEELCHLIATQIENPKVQINQNNQVSEQEVLQSLATIITCQGSVVKGAHQPNAGLKNNLAKSLTLSNNLISTFTNLITQSEKPIQQYHQSCSGSNNDNDDIEPSYETRLFARSPQTSNETSPLGNPPPPSSPPPPGPPPDPLPNGKNPHPDSMPPGQKTRPGSALPSGSPPPPGPPPGPPPPSGSPPPPGPPPGPPPPSGSPPPPGPQQ
ncbi:hypothetical protein GcM3_026040 [Golovinomyces cichoracearum]|uniref:Uncharacterized protein n=1 Tax=Golovinomyces cichoracearum TaxID=62708 RepID=A0A420J643_9PEZI|nr:hypothetical protein GcM3_026040 [Golovinomyces cichoracearum]